MAAKTVRLRIGGMTCDSCRLRVENKLLGVDGVFGVSVVYVTGEAEIVCREDVSTGSLAEAVESAGYSVVSGGARAMALRVCGFILIIAALYLLLKYSGLQSRLLPILANEDMGLLTLFLTGLLTSLHCTAMCGGINISQCLPKTGSSGGHVPLGSAGALRPSLLYNLGRVCSYTAIGFLVGAIGSAVSLSPTAQGALKLAAGVFMIVMGLNLLGLFPFLRRLTPRFPRLIKPDRGGKNGPFYIGLLNGLMPCGPLQAMQIYALSTGSAFHGALSMLIFAIGTLPLMLGLGAAVTALGGRFASKVMTAGAVLVAVLGLSMFSQGWSLASFGDSGAIKSQTPGISSGILDVQEIGSTLSAGKYPNIIVRAGTQVRWTITASESSINGCNNKMYIGEYGIVHVFTPGDNIIEFTPEKTGTFRYSCWMGMIHGSITVVK